MAQFSRIAKGLQSLFPSSGTDIHSPGELTESVSLVHEFPGRAWAWEAIVSQQLVVGPSVTPSGSLLAAAKDEWVEVLWGDISHDSATARIIQLAMFMPPGFNSFLGRWTNFASV